MIAAVLIFITGHRATEAKDKDAVKVKSMFTQKMRASRVDQHNQKNNSEITIFVANKEKKKCLEIYSAKRRCR